jgi:TM2 domain-containing membrane protein YozV
MITCPNCSTSNPESTLVCISCGAPLVEGNDLPTVKPENFEIPEPSPYVKPELIQATPANEAPTTVPASEPAHTPTIYSTTPKKDRSIAIVLEIVPGLFGFLGIGWIYGGFTGAGIAWLVGFLIWNMIALAICIFTVGVGCLCTLPINLVVLIASVIALNSQIQNHNEQFNP